MYIENPKTAGSGIICAIPQKGTCPIRCADCFFQEGRSYLEPLDQNLPNTPTPEEARGQVVRVNDGNDSNNQRDLVIEATAVYPDKFYNTSIPNLDFPGPVVLTVNPGAMTDIRFHKVPKPLPRNLMFVRFRANMWNVELLYEALGYYSEIPVVVTFMRYYKEQIPQEFQGFYEYKKKILNDYWVLNDKGYEFFKDYVFSTEHNAECCGLKTSYCKDCGICLREYRRVQS